MTVMMKNTLRSRIRAQRKNMNSAHDTRHSMHACAWLEKLYLPQEAKIGAYIPLLHEPGWNMAETLMEKGYRVYIPKIVDSTLLWGIFEQNLVPGPFNIMEPAEAPYTWNDLDAVLVPALAIDSQGHRLGQGGGFYDRTTGGHSDIPTAGIIWSHEYMDIPWEEHDLCVNAIITEKGTIPIVFTS